MSNKKVVHMVTVPESLKLMEGQLGFLLDKGYDLTIVCSPGKQLDNLDINRKKPILMSREISLFRDLVSLIKLIKFFSTEKPYIVNSGTPKAGLLGMVASFITRVPERIYTLRGLRLEGEKGLKYKILWFMEKIACTLATEVICISESLLFEAKKINVLNKNKGVVLANGSSNGIPLYKFPNRKEIKSELDNLRKRIGIEQSSFILGFVGRITKDKGIRELLQVFKNLKDKGYNIKLIIIGDYDTSESEKDIFKKEIKNQADIIYLGYKKELYKYYYLMDVLMFLTYREGFGNVSIESQAAGTPVITTNVTGARDTVKHGETGFIVPVKNSIIATEKVIELINNPGLKERLGIQARKRAFENFDSELIWTELEQLYRRSFSDYNK